MSSKDVGLRIRVEKELREAFQGACVAENRGASEVLRAFMQAFVDERHGGRQTDMFPAQASRRPRHPIQRKAI
ncbi:MAG: plasmid-related protein [Beijerinckiaceae bacterium]|nr:plasmid-related protein [Beijerinckiaceae bacterium]